MINKKPITTTTSKTARASLAGSNKEEPFKASGDMDRIISLDSGKWAYLLDPRNGITHHLRVGSEPWNTLIIELDTTEHGSKIRSELERLGWS